ncbi:MAG: ferritin-like domain-containing protein [Thermomicrobiales bacterium]|nr:MAG: ferritin-like domain-containing protein [Thermomicrobiales bacterium]
MTETELSARRAELIAGLQDDLSREYKAIIQYVIYSQVLDGAEYMPIAAELEVHAHEELDHAIAIAKQLDYFGAYPTEKPKPIEVPNDPTGMLWADLRAEDETVAEYRKRIRQAQEIGEFALAEILQEITKQEQDHQIDLAAALGVVADPRGRKEAGPKR